MNLPIHNLLQSWSSESNAENIFFICNPFIYFISLPIGLNILYRYHYRCLIIIISKPFSIIYRYIVTTCYVFGLFAILFLLVCLYFFVSNLYFCIMYFNFVGHVSVIEGIIKVNHCLFSAVVEMGTNKFSGIFI